MKYIFSIVLLFALAACDSSVEVLKSPCAGAEGSPCGPKRPVNGWWLDQNGKPLHIKERA